MITSNPGIKCCFCEEDLSKNKLADNNAWMNQNKWKEGRQGKKKNILPSRATKHQTLELYCLTVIQTKNFSTNNKNK